MALHSYCGCVGGWREAADRSRRIRGWPDSDVRDARDTREDVDFSPLDHVADVVDVVPACVEDDVTSHPSRPPIAEEAGDEAVRPNAVEGVRTEREPRPE